MNRSSKTFNIDEWNDQYTASEIPYPQLPMDQGDGYPDAQTCTDQPSLVIDDATPAQFHRQNSSPIKQPSVRTSGRLADRRAKAESSTSYSSPSRVESSRSSTQSSEIPETQSSQQITTPEDKTAYTTKKSNKRPKPNGSRHVALSTMETRQRKQQSDDDAEQTVTTVKRSRFLERNRAAATKCRQKKREWVTDLEETKFSLESQHNHLQREYSRLKNEITHIKAQLMDHATCNDPNINKWIENEAKRFVLGASERYDQILANLGQTPRHINPHGSFPSTTGYQAMNDSELLSPVTPSQSFHSGTFMPDSPMIYRPGLTPHFPEIAASDLSEEPYPTNNLHNSTSGDVQGFDNMPMVDSFEHSTIPAG
ncbi:hypothetical protein F5Y11DRAFT_345954 [Daldinia sp. FL1419]|nr:hypothetical protein F5Y11DRAFT_345954 [Daldinia sp. FL1419]